MLASAVGRWFRRLPAAPQGAAPVRVVPAAPIGGGRCRTHWPPERIALADSLWGEGFGLPGGEDEVLRLTRSLGPSAAHSLLLVGGGAGGGACAITQAFGAWVAAMETEPELVAAGQRLIASGGFGRKVGIELWQPDQPVFEPHKYHCCAALEPLIGAQPEPILDALTRALKPSGQLVLTDLVVEQALDPGEPAVARWAVLERRNPASLVAPVAVSRMLGRVGLDVRIAEDISDRHLEQMVRGWRQRVRELHGTHLDPAAAAMLVAEAERWLLRWRLMKDGRLRMMRWHAISRGGG